MDCGANPRGARGTSADLVYPREIGGHPHQATIRAIEQGKDVRLSNVERVARALGLTLELVR